MEQVGCFTFVALPLVFGLPVMRAWATVVGEWIFWGYIVMGIAILVYIVYLLERKEGGMRGQLSTTPRLKGRG